MTQREELRMPANLQDREERSGRLYMAGAMVVAGTIGYFVLLSDQSPFNVVFWRCSIGAIGLALYCWWKGYFQSRRLNNRQLLNLVLGGLTLVFNWYFLFTAYRLTSVGITTVAYNSQPFLLLLAGFFFRKEKPGAFALICLATAFVGLVVLAKPVSGHATSGYLLGIACALAAAVLYAATTLLTKTLSATMRPELIAVWHMVIGAFAFALLADFDHLPQLPRHIFAILTLGLFHTTFMYILLYGAFKKAATGSLAILGFIYPLVAVLVDYLAYGTVMDGYQAIGAVLILLAASAYAAGPRSLLVFSRFPLLRTLLGGRQDEKNS